MASNCISVTPVESSFFYLHKIPLRMYSLLFELGIAGMTITIERAADHENPKIAMNSLIFCTTTTTSGYNTPN